MATKSTKNRKKSARARRAARRRQQRMLTAVVFVLLFVCIGAFASIGVVNASKSKSAAPTEWIVEDGGMEILAAPAAGDTLERSSTGAGTTLPFYQGTALPEDEPTLMPMVTPEPEATAEPEATPGVLEPEQRLESVPITITAVGDCTLGGEIKTGAYRSFQSYASKYGPDYFFQNVRSLFESDDLTIVNLEGPLTTSDDMRSGRTFNFRGDPKYVQILSGSSVEIANVANNHSLDFGEAGFTETTEVLEAAGIGVSGFSRVYLTDVKGVRVCSIGFTEWAYSQEQIEKAVRLARANCDLLIVSIHWGEEGSHEATDTQVKLGRAMVDAGADLIIGNHSHVYGGVELYKGKYIIYSLGNFCFGGNRNPGDKNCTIFQQTFNVSLDGTVSDGGINIIPARISGQNDTNDFQPYILSGDAAKAQMKRIASVSNVDASRMLWMDFSQSPVGAVALSGGF